jgi:hypothetical protein
MTLFTQPSDIPARFARVNEAAKRGPFSRSQLYELAREGKIKIRKDGKKSILDLIEIDAVAESLPVAEVPLRKIAA